eukprot:363865-Chlamydomonas_euryale.AAC.25
MAPDNARPHIAHLELKPLNLLWRRDIVQRQRLGYLLARLDERILRRIALARLQVQLHAQPVQRGADDLERASRRVERALHVAPPVGLQQWQARVPHQARCLVHALDVLQLGERVNDVL